MADLHPRRSDLKRQVRDAAKEERNEARKRQCLMQAEEPGTKSKLSLSVADDCGRPPRICPSGDLQLLLQRANQQGFDTGTFFHKKLCWSRPKSWC